MTELEYSFRFSDPVVQCSFPTSCGRSLRVNVVPMAGVSLPSHPLERASSIENLTRATTCIKML